MTARGPAGARQRGAGRPRVVPATTSEPPREAILAAASRLFAERGFVATSVSAIAERAGLRVSSLYYYFDGKEAMLHAIVNEVNRLSLDRLELINREGGRAAVRLFRIICFDVHSLCTLPYDVNEIQRLAALQEKRFASYWRERQELNDRVEQLVVDGMQDGEFREVDERLVSLSILASNEGAQNWYRPLGRYRIQGRKDRSRGEYTPAEIGAHLARVSVGHLLRDRRALVAVERQAAALDAAAEPA